MSLASWHTSSSPLVCATAPVIGWYMALVYGEGKKAPGDRVFLPIERAVYRICRVDEEQEQRWTTYAFAVIGFSIFSLISLYLLLRFQGSLPLNPNNFPGPVHHLSWDTAVSFTTNTNWQSYAGETTMSNLSQMLGLAVHNFTSAAVGMAVLAAFIRGLARRRASTLGNFWVDLTRTMTRILGRSCLFALRSPAKA
jgi:K+-transporting ATPase ATPase A chain